MITIENNKYYTIQELATSLKVTPQTIRAWIKQDKLKGKKVGKRILIREDKIIEFLDANSQPTSINITLQKLKRYE